MTIAKDVMHRIIGGDGSGGPKPDESVVRLPFPALLCTAPRFMCTSPEAQCRSQPALACPFVLFYPHTHDAFIF
jgi:hypothetical protein